MQTIVTAGRRTDDSLVRGRLDVVGEREPVVPAEDACLDERDNRERKRENTHASARYYSQRHLSIYNVDRSKRPYLALLDLVPPLNIMLHDIQHRLARKRHMHVVPRHAPGLDRAQPVADVVGHVLEVHDPRVVVVLAREERRERVRGVHVRERVRVRVPAPEAEVEPADARVVVVDDDDLLVVRPELDVVCAESQRRERACPFDSSTSVVRVHDQLFNLPLLPMWSGWRMHAMFGCSVSRVTLVWCELMVIVCVTSL